MNFISRLISCFVKTPVSEVMEDENKPVSRYKNFTVEYYPETKKYFCRYKKGYLQKHWQTGIVEIKGDWIGFTYADKFNTEEQAWKLIDLCIEQRCKENVVYLKRD